MNIVFFGSARFALGALKALLTSRYRVSCVVTQPDKQKGRGLSLTATPVKALALERGLKVYQPDSINTPPAARFLKGLNPDLFIVIAYGQILSPEILAIPKIFSINLHGSLLPKYRGAAPINWAIIKGERTTGISIIKMAPEMDAGPVIMQEEAVIEKEDTAAALEEKLAEKGARLLLESLKAIENNNYNLLTQDEKKATLAPKLKKEDGLIDWNKTAEDIYNLIRGIGNWPGAFTYYKGKLLKIYKGKVCPFRPLHSPAASAGQTIEVSKEGIVAATGKDNLAIEELQLEGKRRMSAGEFIAGHKITAGEILGNKK